MLECGQVQEKKVKKISDMNMDHSQVAGNGDIAGSSASTGQEVCLPNGRCSDRPYNYPSSDYVFPPGGIPSLRLPVVVVLSLIYWLLLLFIIIIKDSAFLKRRWSQCPSIITLLSCQKVNYYGASVITSWFY